jgi:hypothetical protein
VPDRPAASEVSSPATPRGVFRPGQPREVFRLAPPVVLWWVWLVFAGANIADIAIQGTSARFTLVVSAVLVTITGVVYTLAFRPRVIAGPAGLVIVNPFRDHYVPWAAVQAVDSGDWVQVHHAAAPGAPSSAAGKAISCWALYVSARTKRRAARATLPPPRRRSRLAGTLPWRAEVPSPWLPVARGYGGSSDPADISRLPEEAKYLASLPAAKAIALRLESRAKKERSRSKPAPAASPSAVIARWAWPAVAAVALPALALLIILLT